MITIKLTYLSAVLAIIFVWSDLRTAQRTDESTYILIIHPKSDVNQMSNSIHALTRNRHFEWNGRIRKAHPRINTMIVQGDSGTCEKLQDELSDVLSCEEDSRIFTTWWVRPLKNEKNFFRPFAAVILTVQKQYFDQNQQRSKQSVREFRSSTFHRKSVTFSP